MANQDSSGNDSTLESSAPHSPETASISTFIAEVIAFGVASTGFWVLGEHLISHGFPKTGTWVNFFACALFLSVIPLGAHQKWPKLRTKLCIGFVAFLILLAFAWFAISQHLPYKPVSHLNLLLRAPNRDAAKPPFILELTNDFISVKEDSSFDPTALGGLVAIPVIPGSSSNGLLNIVIENDSEVIAEGITLVLLLDTNIVCLTNSAPIEGASWQRIALKGGNWTSHFNGWAIRSPLMLHRDDQAFCPDLLIKPDDGWANEMFPTVLQIRAKDMPIEYFAFWLIAKPGLIGPQLLSLKDVKRTLVGGKMHFDILEIQ